MNAAVEEFIREIGHNKVILTLDDNWLIMKNDNDVFEPPKDSIREQIFSDVLGEKEEL